MCTGEKRNRAVNTENNTSCLKTEETCVTIRCNKNDSIHSNNEKFLGMTVLG